MTAFQVVILDPVNDLLDSPQVGDTYLLKRAAHFEQPITVDSTVDGRDIAVDGVALDAAVSGLAATVIVANAALPKAGGEVSGNVTCAGTETFDGRDLSVDGAKLDWLTVTQAVDLDAMETRQTALATAFVWGGSWDASAGPFPTSTVAGETWRVTVGGTVDSVIFNVGDMITALVDGASIAVYAGNWIKIDNTDAVTSVNGNIGAVVLDSDDLAEGATNLYLTAAERAKLGFLTITQAVDADAIETNSNASKVITDWITVTQAVNLDTVETDTAASKVITDWITVTQAVNLDTIETDVAASKVKTDWITVTQAVDLDTMESGIATNTAAIAANSSPAYGEISVQAGVTAEATVDATPRKLGAWNTNGLSLLTTPDHTQDHIEIDSDGIYEVLLAMCFTGTASKTYQISIYKNGIDTGYAADRKLGTGGDVGSLNIHCMLDLDDDDIITIYQSSSDGGSAMTVTEAQMGVSRIGVAI